MTTENNFNLLDLKKKVLESQRHIADNSDATIKSKAILENVLHISKLKWDDYASRSPNSMASKMYRTDYKRVSVFDCEDTINTPYINMSHEDIEKQLDKYTQLENQFAHKIRQVSENLVKLNAEIAICKNLKPDTTKIEYYTIDLLIGVGDDNDPTGADDMAYIPIIDYMMENGLTCTQLSLDTNLLLRIEYNEFMPDCHKKVKVADYHHIWTNTPESTGIWFEDPIGAGNDTDFEVVDTFHRQGLYASKAAFLLAQCQIYINELALQEGM